MRRLMGCMAIRECGPSDFSPATLSGLVGLEKGGHQVDDGADLGHIFLTCKSPHETKACVK